MFSFPRSLSSFFPQIIPGGRAAPPQAPRAPVRDGGQDPRNQAQAAGGRGQQVVVVAEKAQVHNARRRRRLPHWRSLCVSVRARLLRLHSSACMCVGIKKWHQCWACCFISESWLNDFILFYFPSLIFFFNSFQAERLE